MLFNSSESSDWGRALVYADLDSVAVVKAAQAQRNQSSFASTYLPDVSNTGAVFESKNPAKDFCWWDLDGVVVVCRAVVDGSLDLFARSTCFFI
jgi:hypothetical protein